MLTDPRQNRLQAIAERLERLLAASPNPLQSMENAANRLTEAGLADGMPDATTPAAFAQAMISQNPLMFEQIGELRNEFDPNQIETSEDLISHLMPAESL